MTKEVWDIQDDQEYELVSNGLLFDRIPGVAKALLDTNCVLTITKHSEDESYLKLFDKAIDKITSSGVNFRIHDATSNWLRFYHGYGSSIEPIDSISYQDSWDNCPTGQENFQLLDGKIYKCAPLAYLPLQKQKYGDLLSEKWDPYLKYRPLLPTDSDLEVLEFFTRSAEPVCSLCPNKKIEFKKSNPLHPPR